jgi:hypothetical protein
MGILILAVHKPVSMSRGFPSADVYSYGLASSVSTSVSFRENDSHSSYRSTNVWFRGAHPDSRSWSLRLKGWRKTPNAAP